MSAWRLFADVNNDGYRTIQATDAGAGITKGDFVKRSGDGTGTVLKGTANAAVLGIAASTFAASGTGYIWTSGEFQSDAGANEQIYQWDAVTLVDATNWYIEDATSGEKICGYASIASSAQGQPARMILNSELDTPEGIGAAA